MSIHAGKRLRYLIGADGSGKLDLSPQSFVVLPYDFPETIYPSTVDAIRQKSADIAGYCNLYWQDGAPDCAPYLDSTDTAEEYGERVIDPKGVGWALNLSWQFKRWKDLGVWHVELDNPDAYEIQDVIRAIDTAQLYGLKVIAKNPLLMDAKASRTYLEHPNVKAAIVEKGCGNPRDMDALRRAVGKPDLLVWFVAFGDGRNWANDTAKRARNYFGMGVTLSTEGEYENSVDILVPR